MKAIATLEELQAMEAAGTLAGFFDVENDIYHRGPGISKSGLDYINDSPAHYREHRRNPPEPTDAQVFGTACHQALIEPASFMSRYAMLPEELTGRSNAAKADKAAWLRERPGVTPLSPKEWLAIQEMMDAFHSHPLSQGIIGANLFEPSGYWVDPEHEVLCRVRPDILTDMRIIFDVKTCLSARKEDFERAAFNYRYHVQAAWYLDGATAITGKTYDEFVFLAVEKQRPYAVAMFRADEAFLAAGRAAARANLARYAECLKADQWPGYPAVVQTLMLPRWAAQPQV